MPLYSLEMTSLSLILLVFGVHFISSAPTQHDIDLATDLPEGGNIWAVLIAGSNTYVNYRHQADVCHAYQLLHTNGISDEHIVVFMYDDIAYNERNPNQGVIINEPNGTNVYQGVPKDYTGDDVNVANFKKVLLGDAVGMEGIGSGKVLKTGPNDHVFIYFVDHGAPLVLSFPNETFFARDFMDILMQMHDKSLYSRMVVYLEACESGSMFVGRLPTDANIFVTTAASPFESSYAVYYDRDLKTFLGDLYSIAWIKDSEKSNLEKETLLEQYEDVREITTLSHVKKYGDMNVGKMHIGAFHGIPTSTGGCENKTLSLQSQDKVPSPDVPLFVLNKQIESESETEKKKELERELDYMIQKQNHVDTTVDTIVQSVTSDELVYKKMFSEVRDISNVDCYYKVVDHFSSQCFFLPQNPYALRKLFVLGNLCGVFQTEDIIQSISATCYNWKIIEKAI